MVGREERPRHSCAQQGRGTQARPGAGQHDTGAAAARAEAGDGLTGPCQHQKVSEATMRLPGSTHAGAGVPMTVADDTPEQSHQCTTSTMPLA